MKYIDKSGEKSLQGKEILEAWVAANASTIQLLSLQGKSNDLWNKFDKALIKKHLHIEQDGLCCYCGRELVNRVHHIVVEHFKLKSSNPQNQYPNMFDYKNLMLSCHGNKFIFYTVKSGDTWQSISLESICSFKVNKLIELRKMNPDTTILQQNGEPKIGELLIVGYEKGTDDGGEYVLHCDNFRNNLPLNINPTQDINCIDRFVYTVQNLDETGRVIHKIGDAHAEEAIKNLNLNAPVLIGDREAIVKEAIQLAEEISNEIEEFEATDKASILEIVKRKLSGIKQRRFYVVYRAYFMIDYADLFQNGF
jgi:uncharacterized protein (TIGR02646 family)